MKDIFKSMLWGLTALIVLGYLVSMSFIINLPVSEKCLLTAEKVNVLISKIAPIVNSLASQFPGEESQSHMPGMLDHLESGKANEEINRVTYEVCHGATYYHSNSLFEIFSPKSKLELLEKYQMGSYSIANYNILNFWMRMLGGIVGFVVGAVFFYRLLRIKRFSVKSNFYFLLAMAPILMTATSVSLIYSDLSLSIHNLEQAIAVIGISVVWIFLVFPAMYVSAKKQGGLKLILFPVVNCSKIEITVGSA